MFRKYIKCQSFGKSIEILERGLKLLRTRTLWNATENCYEGGIDFLVTSIDNGNSSEWGGVWGKSSNPAWVFNIFHLSDRNLSR